MYWTCIYYMYMFANLLIVCGTYIRYCVLTVKLKNPKTNALPQIIYKPRCWNKTMFYVYQHVNACCCHFGPDSDRFDATDRNQRFIFVFSERHFDFAWGNGSLWQEHAISIIWFSYTYLLTIKQTRNGTPFNLAVIFCLSSRADPIGDKNHVWW